MCALDAGAPIVEIAASTACQHIAYDEASAWVEVFQADNAPCVTISDEDDDFLISATVALTADGGSSYACDPAKDVLALNLPAGSPLSSAIHGFYDASKCTLQLVPVATTMSLADFSQVLQGVVFYSSDSQNPTNFGRNPLREVSLSVVDAGTFGATATRRSATVKTTIHINTIDGKLAGTRNGVFQRRCHWVPTVSFPAPCRCAYPQFNEMV